MKSLLGSLLRCKFFILIIWTPSLHAQGWNPETQDIYPKQYSFPAHFQVHFKADGPLGLDWMYGGWLDHDSIRRCVAYRMRGRWIPLPFSGYFANVANDIEMYGDTLYIGGTFQDLLLDKDSIKLPSTYLLKWYNDSLWTTSSWQNPGPIYGVDDMAVKGDSLLIWGGSYYNSLDSSYTYTHFMTPDRGNTWQYPYSIIHPTSSMADFGSKAQLEILPNGDILTINNGSNVGSPFRGVSRWDGQQWHSYGSGLSGTTSKTLNIAVFEGNLYMGGTFNKSQYPQDPGNFIASWKGSSWENVGGGTVGFVNDLFVYDSILYCNIDGGFSSSHRFGDAAIPYFAGWNKHQWCGTPTNFGSPPTSFGIIKDTLFVAFQYPTTVNGDSVSYLNYYDGDYLNGPNSICSTLGLGEEELSAGTGEFKIFPNPAGDAFTIACDSSDPLETIKVYDLKGQCVLENDRPENFSAQFNISHLAPGIYMVSINGKYNQKLVKL